MAMDVYGPCPCGSGKKLKFCCQNLAEDMDRISRLIDNHQPRQALQQLEQLDRKASSESARGWVVTTQAIVELQMNDAATARDRLRKFLDQHPEHDFANVLYAAAVVQIDGLNNARAAIARAFQKGAKKYSSMVSGLAGAMSNVFFEQEQYLAAREHLALSLRFAPESKRQELFVQMLDFDSDAAIPYLMRSAHPLPTLQPADEHTAELKKAHKYAAVGCWDTAADSFEKLATLEPQQAAQAWHSAGLCRAWYGQEEAAAIALHKAAELYSDPAAAVDCEALAQVLDWKLPSQRVARGHQVGNVTSIGRLLTSLDASDRLMRMPVPPPDPDGTPQPAAIYHLLSNSRHENPAIADLTVENVPRTLATVIILDAIEKEPGKLIVNGIAGHGLESACSLMEELCGDIVDVWQPVNLEGEYLPLDVAALAVFWTFPEKTPVAVRRRIENQRSRQVVQDVWLTRPLLGLQGKSPREAASLPELRVRLLAAVYVLDAVCLRFGFELNVDGLLQQLGVEPLPLLELSDDTPLNSLSPLQWLRLPLEQLNDEQLTAVANRAQLVHHDRFLYETLKLILSRPDCLAQLDQTRIYQTLADLCRVHERREEAFHWFQEGRRVALEKDHPFEEQWSWDLRELLMRLEDPNDPGLETLSQKFVNYYAPKLPQVRPYLEQMFDLAGVRSPFLTSSLVTPDSLGGSGGGLWTPGQAEPAAAGSGGLWIPGN